MHQFRTKISRFSGVLCLFFLFVTTPGCQRQEEQTSKSLSESRQENINTEKTVRSGSNQSKSVNVGAMIFISAGEFILGSNKEDSNNQKQSYGLVNALYVDEHPQQTMKLDAFYISQYETTNREYKAFVQATKRKEPFYWTQNGYNLVEARLKETDLETLRWIASEYFKFDLDTATMSKQALLDAMKKDHQYKDNLPVTYVTWFDAKDYCQWRGMRLPSEYEWERVARGPDGLEYPWGNEWNPEITNIGDNSEWPDGIAPVGSYPNNKSPEGVFDMSGNVWEWVDSWYKPYPGSTLDRKSFGETSKVVRGGGGGEGHYALSIFFRSASRSFAPPITTSNDIGFRCASSIPMTETSKKE